MNTCGSGKIPFLFVIDFEMQKICLFRTDDGLPEGIGCSFPSLQFGAINSHNRTLVHFKKFPIPYSSYSRAFECVMDHIRNGNSFLLNLTFPTRIETNLSLGDIYNQSTAKYKLYLNDELVCFSPETFVTIRDGKIISCPMKGTIRASVPHAREIIVNDPKETAEHHTIVDLIRNDLSMVATDICVKRFRYIEEVTTHEGDILQVSSEITGKLPPDFHHRLGDILFSLLPAGSVSGAPKQKTIDIIRQAEGAPRGYYTGVFGYFDGKDLDSAVIIRFIERRNDGLWFRSGGGITCNSDPEKEYSELIDKVYVPIM